MSGAGESQFNLETGAENNRGSISADPCPGFISAAGSSGCRGVRREDGDNGRW